MGNSSSEADRSPATSIPGTSGTGKSKSTYVNSLMDEAEDLTVDSTGSVEESELLKIEKTTDASWNYDEQALETCEPGMSHAEFENNLKRNYFGTYSLYQKLDPTAKSLVFKAYQKDSKIEHITKVISELVK